MIWSTMLINLTSNKMKMMKVYLSHSQTMLKIRSKVRELRKIRKSRKGRNNMFLNHKRMQREYVTY